MLITRCIKVIMPSKPVFGGYIGMPIYPPNTGFEGNIT